MSNISMIDTCVDKISCSFRVKFFIFPFFPLFFKMPLNYNRKI